jgi:CheY-like chemotaxis protein
LSLDVILVDDDADTGEAMQMLLGAFGHEVRIAQSGAQALGLLDASLPDIMFIDLGLPEMDGLELARRIRARFADRQLRLVALTGYTRAENVREAMDAGFDLHLGKPADMTMLERTLNDCEAQLGRR